MGLEAFNAETSKIAIFLALFAGIVLHWIYEVAVAAIKNGGTWNFGAPGVIAARFVISLIAAITGFVAAYGEVQKVDEGFRIVSAIVTGLGVDALTAPWTHKEPPVI